LPDLGGLTALDVLKSDSRTSEIPVHVMSADDKEQVALLR